MNPAELTIRYAPAGLAIAGIGLAIAITGFLRASLPFVVGSSGVALRRLIPFSAVSALAWTATFVFIGYAFAESAESAGETATRVALVVVLLAIAAFTIRARRTR